jgi:hypothetical protein
MYTSQACSVIWYTGKNIIVWDCLGIGVVGLKKTVKFPSTVSIIFFDIRTGYLLSTIRKYSTSQVNSDVLCG